MRPTLFLLIPAALATFGGSAMAQPILRPNPETLIVQADANHDGLTTRAEFQAARAAEFNRLDRARLGYISVLTLPPMAVAAGGEKLRAALAIADANHDGRVSRAEFTNAPAPNFELADVDHNNVVTQAERYAASRRLQAAR